MLTACGFFAFLLYILFLFLIKNTEIDLVFVMPNFCLCAVIIIVKKADLDGIILKTQ